MFRGLVSGLIWGLFIGAAVLLVVAETEPDWLVAPVAEAVAAL